MLHILQNEDLSFEDVSEDDANNKEDEGQSLLTRN